MQKLSTSRSAPLADPRSGYALIILAVFFFSLLGVVIRSLGATLHFGQIALVRSAVGALIAAGALAARTDAPPLRNMRAMWGRSLVGLCAMVAYFGSVTDRSVPLGDVIAIRNTAPLLTVLGAWVLLRETPRARIYVAWTAGFIGVLAIAGPGFETKWWVALLAITAAVFSAGSNLFLRVLRAESSERVVLHFSLVCTVAMAAVAPFVWRTPSVSEWLLLIASGLLAGVGQLCLTGAYARAPAGPVAVTGYLGMVFSYLWSILIFEESYTVASVFGAVCITGAGVWIAASAPRRS
ncbi:MAG: DMT family transporter [Myxococcota bacterium]